MGSVDELRAALVNHSVTNNIREALVEGGIIILKSCSTGKGRNNFADMMYDVFPQAGRIFAPEDKLGPHINFENNDLILQTKRPNEPIPVPIYDAVTRRHYYDGVVRVNRRGISKPQGDSVQASIIVLHVHGATDAVRLDINVRLTINELRRTASESLSACL